jgi:hypothetical protein
VVDYAKLAEKAKANQDLARSTTGRPETEQYDPAIFYQNVKTYLVGEINKANPELSRHGVPTLDRSFLPSFLGKFCFTFGMSSNHQRAAERQRDRPARVSVQPRNLGAAIVPCRRRAGRDCDGAEPGRNRRGHCFKHSFG